MNKLVVLGATGSIGAQTIEVAERLGLEIAGLAAGSVSSAFTRLAARFPDARLAVARPPDRTDKAPARLSVGPDAVADLARQPNTTVINGVVGIAGLRASLAALEAGNRLALANKETLVAAGPLVLAAARAGGGEIIPVDSEHSAIHQCLEDDPKAIAKIILTASGGPFFGRTKAELVAVTPEEALRHPTWNMGPRITTDSATLVNKGLEVIEAHVLFGVEYEQIEVVVHLQSIVHSLVEFVDGSLKAHVGHPDMRIPIQYAITLPERRPSPVEPFSLAGLSLTFDAPDLETFPALPLAYAAGRKGGAAPCAFNAADEIAVAAFHEGRIGFTEIPRVLEEAVAAADSSELHAIEDVIEADEAARAVARSAVGSL